MKRLFLLIFLIITGFHTKLSAQSDTIRYNSVGDFLREGKVGGSSRSYFMYTDNSIGLSDYNGLGMGAGINYQTPKFKGFSAGMSGFFVSNILSSDFTQLDKITQNPNRYELGLFDVTNPESKHELTRLEELWLRFEHKNSSLKLGKYVPTNLFINGQDGRMRPTMVQGLQFVSKVKNTQIDVQLFSKISPRSTVKWYLVSETLGIYPSGRNPDGTASNYYLHTKTSGVLIAQLTNSSIKHTTVTLGEITVPNVFQTYYLNTEFSNKNIFAGLLLVGQHPLENGGSDFAATTYANSTDKSMVASGQIGKKIRNHAIDVNFTTIRSSGRFLMPREWGREPFYTFMPRERNEGLGNVNAISTNLKLGFSPQLKAQLAYGKFFLPDPANPLHNKYAIPSYNQYNFFVNYTFKSYLKGLTIRGLYVRKDKLNTQIENPKYIFNKVNLNLYNLILDFSF